MTFQNEEENWDTNKLQVLMIKRLNKNVAFKLEQNPPIDIDERSSKKKCEREEEARLLLEAMELARMREW